MATRAFVSHRAAMASATGDTPAGKPRVVIAGAGVIGASTAYHLAANHGMRCTLYDQKGAGCAASGKAGGFLALDWCDGSPVGELARVSFAMHEELAKTLSLDSYRRLTCEAVAVDERAVVAAGGVAKPGNKKLESVEWADIGAVASRPMGTEETIAQVHPKRLTEAFLDAANAKAGTEVVLGKVEGVVTHEVTGEVTGVVVDGETVPADVVVVAMGPWTHRASTWAPGMPKVILGQKYHAVLMRPERVLTQAVFFQGLGDPEFYPRGDGDVYVCAYPDSPNVVDEEPGEVEVRPDAVRRLVDVARAVSSEMKNAEVNGSGQSCHLPITQDGMPVMGAVPGTNGLYVTTGHSCWGILNSPASGAAMAELIATGSVTCVKNFDAFSPKRFAQ